MFIAAIPRLEVSGLEWNFKLLFFNQKKWFPLHELWVLEQDCCIHFLPPHRFCEQLIYCKVQSVFMDINFLRLYMQYTFKMHFITIFLVWAHVSELYRHCILLCKIFSWWHCIWTLLSRLYVMFTLILSADCDFSIMYIFSPECYVHKMAVLFTAWKSGFNLY
jgi:hypothetical protein